MNARRPARDSVLLRAVRPDDVPLLFQYQLDPLSNDMAMTHPRDAAAFHAVWGQIAQNPEIVARVIESDGRVVGSISRFPRDGRHFVGYWIPREHWGRGIATRALELLLQEVTTRPLYAQAARSNAASIRVLERCGFVLTGYSMGEASERFRACEEALFRLD